MIFLKDRQKQLKFTCLLLHSKNISMKAFSLKITLKCNEMSSANCSFCLFCFAKSWMKTTGISQSVYLNSVKACTEMKTWLLAWVLQFCLAAFYILGKSGRLQLPFCKCNVVVQTVKAYSRPHAKSQRGVK